MAEIVITEEVWRRLSDAVRRVEGQVRALAGLPHRLAHQPCGLQVVEVTSSTPSSGRYPGKVQEYDPSTNTFSDLGDIWVVDCNGASLTTGYYLARRYGEYSDRLVFAVQGRAGVPGNVALSSGETLDLEDGAAVSAGTVTHTITAGDTYTVAGDAWTFSNSTLTLNPSTLVVPATIYGSTSSGGQLTLASTTHGTKGGVKIAANDWLVIPEIAAPGTPSTNTGALYSKSDGLLYWKDDAGVEYDLTASGTSLSLTEATGGSQTISADSTWTDTSAVLTDLPAGIYWIVGEVNGIAEVSATPPGEIRMRLYNQTDSVAIGQERRVVTAPVTGVSCASAAMVSHKLTLAAAKTIRVQVWRSSGPTWTTSAGENSRISAIKVS